MAKRIKIKPILGLERKPIQIPDRDDSGNPILEDEKVKLRDFTIIDAINILIRSFPRERLTMENITSGGRLKGQALDATNGVVVIEEAEHDWFKKMLNDKVVGPKVYGFDLLSIIGEVDSFERLHEKKEPTEKEK